MQADLKTRLFSNVLLSTKAERLTIARRVRQAFSWPDLISVAAAIVAGAGLVMLLISKVKPLF